MWRGTSPTTTCLSTRFFTRVTRRSDAGPAPAPYDLATTYVQDAGRGSKRPSAACTTNWLREPEPSFLSAGLYPRLGTCGGGGAVRRFYPFFRPGDGLCLLRPRLT